MATQDNGGFQGSEFDFSNFLDEDDEIVETEKEVSSDFVPASQLKSPVEETAVAVSAFTPEAEEPTGFSPVETELVGLFPEGKPVAKSPDEITTGGLDLDLKEAYEGYLSGGKMSWGNKRQAKKHFEEALKLEDALRDADKAILARAGGYASIIANLSDEKLLLEEKSFLKGDEEDYYADEEVETSDSALASRAAQIQSTDLYKELERLETHRSSINTKRIAALEGLKEATSNEDNKYWLGLSTAISERLKGIADVQDVTKSKVSVEDEEVFEKGVEHFEGYLSGDFDPLNDADDDEDAEFEPYRNSSEDDAAESVPNLGYLNQHEESYPEDEGDDFPHWAPEPVAEVEPTVDSSSLGEIEDLQETVDGLEPAANLFTSSNSDFDEGSFFDEELPLESGIPEYSEIVDLDSAPEPDSEFELIELVPSLEADLSAEDVEEEAHGHDGPALAESPFWGDSDMVEEDSEIESVSVVSENVEPLDENFESDPWSAEEQKNEDDLDFESDPWGQDDFENESEPVELEQQESEFAPVEAVAVRERFDEQNSFIIPVEPDREPVRAVIFEELKAKHKIDFD